MSRGTMCHVVQGYRNKVVLVKQTNSDTRTREGNTNNYLIGSFIPTSPDNPAPEDTSTEGVI